jgi:N,N'-diacetyl-8-epilegionaminate cytidylyltransferase
VPATGSDQDRALKKIFAFIFARGGSKGLPGKNIRRLGGIPLVGHSILIAKKMPQIERIFVSTEDPDIRAVAEDYGAEVIERPAELAEDTSPEWQAWHHAVEQLSDKGDEFDTFLSLPATSPLRSSLDVEACINKLEKNVDAVITVTHASRSPFFNMVSRTTDGDTEILADSDGYVRRQDAPEAFDVTTVAYVLRKDFILENRSLFAGRVKSVIIPKERAIDIDDEIDFKVAEVLYSEMQDDSEK